jgi:hypothetical protein
MQQIIYCSQYRNRVKQQETYGERNLVFFCDQRCADEYENREIRSQLRRDLLDSIQYAEFGEDETQDVVRVIKRIVEAKHLFERNLEKRDGFLVIDRSKVQFRWGTPV